MAGNIQTLIVDWKNENKTEHGSKRLVEAGTTETTRADEGLRAAAISAHLDGFPGIALPRFNPKTIVEPSAALKPLQAMQQN